MHDDDIDISTMKRYISYCRDRCAPTLSDEAAVMLRSHYVRIRDEQRTRAHIEGASASTVPITVRQLEAIARIAESLAKMTLSIEATPTHVQEAIRLFRVSSGHAANSGSVMGEDFLRPEAHSEVLEVEAALKRRVAVGNDVRLKRLIEEFSHKGYHDFAVRKAIHILVARGDFQEHQMRKVMRRVR